MLDLNKPFKKTYSNNSLILQKQVRKILIITGCSGAGKTSVMRGLEDIGFYCVDNLPIPLLSTFFHLAFKAQTGFLKIALGIDVRGQQFLSGFILEIGKLKQPKGENLQLKVIFLNACDETLIKRFQETRRKHPLISRGVSLLNAIQKEKDVLDPIMAMSDVILDTDRFSIHDLRRWVNNVFSEKYQQEVLVNLISFGFKYGVPIESNMVYDLRFLPNPYFIPELKLLDGRKPAVQMFLFKHPDVLDYWKRIIGFLHYFIKKSYKEGMPYVNIAIGCTGGKHRSVAFVEKIGQHKWDKVKFLIHHRDLGKE